MALTRINSYLVDLDSLGGITFDDNAGTPTFKVDAVNHRVGIGIASPETKLQVVGNVLIKTDSPSPALIIRDSDSDGDVSFTQWNSGDLQVVNNATNRNIIFQTHDGTSVEERLCITSDGNVGIGTTTPTQPLDVAGNVNISSGSEYLVAGSQISTANVAEDPSYLYYTDARAISAVTGSNLDMGSNTITTTGAGSFASLSTGALGVGVNISTGTISGPATLTIDPAAVGDNTGTVVIAGDLQVDGTTTTINSTTLTVDDKNIVLASGAVNAAAADGAGVTIDTANATLLYKATPDAWSFNKSVGIGTDDPQDTLSIGNTSGTGSLTLFSGTSIGGDPYGKILFRHGVGNGNRNAKIAALRTGGSSGADLAFYTRKQADAVNTDGGLERLRINSDGNVGIGTDDPDSKLHIESSWVVSSDTNDIATFARAGNAVNLTIGYDSLLTDMYLGTKTNHTLQIRTNNTPRLTIISSGNIGIGTNNPQALLQLGSRTSASPQGNLHVVRGEALGGGTGPSISLIHGPDSGTQRHHQIYSYVGDLRIVADSNENMEFHTGGSESLRITSGGNVSIGALVSPGALLHLRDSNNATQGNAQLKISKGVGSGAAPTSTSRANCYIHLGSSEWGSGANGQYLMGFGYTNGETGTGIPAYIGFKETSTSGYTVGDLIFGTRDNNTGTNNAQERLRIRSNGDLILGPYDAPGSYTTPANNVPYSIKVAPYGWQHHSELAEISMGNHSGSNGNDDGEIVFKTTKNAHSSTTGLVERLRITSDGNVGIGTTNPISELMVENATQSHITVKTSGSNMAKFGSKGNDVYIGGTAGAANIIFKRNIVSTDHPADSGTETLRIASDGKIAIGGNYGDTSTFGRQVLISGTVGLNNDSGNIGIGFSRGSSNTYGYIGTGDWALNGLANDDFGISSGATGDLAFGTEAGTERLRIASTGQLNVNQANNNNLQGQVTIFEGTDFNSASQGGRDNIYLISDRTSGNGRYGASIAWSRVQYADRRAAAIVNVQTSSDEDQVGLAFFTHPGSNPTDAVVEKFRITHDGQFGMNGVRNIYQSFLLANNQNYNWDFTVPSEGGYGNSFYLVAGYNHYYTTSYGAHRTVWFSARGTAVSSMGNGIEQYHSQSGSWTFSKPNATTVRITKTAGTYTGTGYGFFHLMYNHF
jgi:hypothetical protein